MAGDDEAYLLRELRERNHFLEKQVKEQATELHEALSQLQRHQDDLQKAIAEHRRTEERLRESETQYRLIIENASDVVWRVDSAYVVTYISPADEQLRGYKADEIIGRHVFEMFNEEGVAAIQNMAQQRFEAEQRGIQTDVVTFEAEHRCKDGRWLWAEVSYSPERDAAGRIIGFHGITREITRRKLAEDETRRARAAAEEASKAKSQFLATISHEIRTPLNALVGFSTLARNATDPAKINQYLSILEQSSLALKNLVDDVLDISKIGSGQLNLEVIPISLRQLIAGLEEQYHQLAQQKMLRFQVSVDDRIPSWVLGDPLRLQQILNNLLSNAVKFTDHGDVTCTLSRHEDITGELVRIQVQDSGIGIPSAFLPNIFHPFRQLDPSISRKFGGSGLGLAIVHSLVTLMKGSISVKSTEGSGSCFIVDLPLPETEPLSPEHFVPAVKHVQQSILVVEDNHFNQQLLRDILTSWGHLVTLSEDGHEALALSEQRPFDLVLLDIRMPDIDGIEVARRLRLRQLERSEAVVPIIAITADVDFATREACHAAGINVVLTKPIIVEDLARVIALHCKETRASTLDQEQVPLLTPQTLEGLNHNPERIQNFLEILLSDIDNERRCLHLSLERDDRKALARAAHTLQGLYGYLESRQPVELVAWVHNNALSASLAELRQVVERLPARPQSFS